MAKSQNPQSTQGIMFHSRFRNPHSPLAANVPKFAILHSHPMLRLLFILCTFSSTLYSQADDSARKQLYPDRYQSQQEADLHQQEMEVEYFAQQLALLKEAVATNNAGNIAVRESAVLMALRKEMNQLEVRIAADANQAEQRKSAGSGVINQAPTVRETPTRDPLAEPVTPDEKRFEAMEYTLAAFDRHSFDPAKPDDAARDFAKLDNILSIMREALAELKAARK